MGIFGATGWRGKFKKKGADNVTMPSASHSMFHIFFVIQNGKKKKENEGRKKNVVLNKTKRWKLKNEQRPLWTQACTSSGFTKIAKKKNAIPSEKNTFVTLPHWVLKNVAFLELFIFLFFGA